MMSRTSLRAILDDSTLAGLLPADIEVSARAALVQAAQDEMPWYLRLLMGGAAWVGALFMLGTVLGLVALALGERVDLAALVIGLGLMPAGVRLRAARGREFLRQASLVCVIAGQLLVLGAVGSLSTPAAAALAAIVSSAVLVAVFDEPVYRFGGTLAIIAALLFIAFEQKVPYTMGLVTAATAVVPIGMWRVWPAAAGPAPQRLQRILDPIAWACATTACGLLALQAAIDAVTGMAGYSPGFIRLLLPRPWPLTALFVALLVWLTLRIARDHGSASNDAAPLVAVAAVVAVGALTFSAPAVSGAILFVVLGFDRRRIGLVALAATFLVGFLGLYYYSLSLTLWQKSVVLVASGAVCLAASASFTSRAREAQVTT
jgi:Domain of unknown function (DUF4401)